MTQPTDSRSALRVLVYSDDATVRTQVVQALGRRPAPELPVVAVTEVATEPLVISTVKAGGIDAIVLDGESVPAGGLGVCRTLKSEVYQCPPILVLTGREQDRWLASWARADAVVSQIGRAHV